MAAARYWRLVAVETYGYANDLTLAGLHMYVDGARVDVGATITEVLAHTSGPLANLNDTNIGTTVTWSGSDIRKSGFSLTWDLGSAFDVQALYAYATSDALAFIYGMTVQSSADSVSWDTVRTFSGITYPGAGVARIIQLSTGGDLHYTDVELLIHATSPIGPTSLLDSGPSNRTVTSGGAYLSSTVVRSQTTSIAFSGGNYLYGGTHTGLGTGDFTIESAVYLTSYSVGWAGLCDTMVPNSAGTRPNSILCLIDATGRPYAYSNSVGYCVGPSISLNTWHHIAYVRTSGILTLFIDGVAVASSPHTVNITGGSYIIGTGGDIYGNSSYTLQGYMDEYRITKYARYTVNFTPSTVAFDNPVSSGDYALTPLLIHGEGSNGSTTVVNSGAPSISLTATGTGSISTGQVKVGSSALRLSNGGSLGGVSAPFSSALALAGGDFTIESWVYVVSYSSWCALFSNGTGFVIRMLETSLVIGGVNYNTQGFSLPANAWHHFALSVTNDIGYVFVDGVLLFSIQGFAATVSEQTSGDVLIGYVPGSFPFDGYVDEFRITKGLGRYSPVFAPSTQPFGDYQGAEVAIDPFYYNVSLSLHMNGTSVLDSGQYAFSHSVVGGISLSSTQSKFGGKSLYRAGPSYTPRYLSFPDAPALNMGSGDFTIEAWVYPETLADFSMFLCKQGNSDYVNFAIGYMSNGSLYVAMGSSGGMFGGVAGTLVVNAWQHVAVVRKGSACAVYVNGASIHTWSSTANLTNTQPLLVGYLDVGEPFQGYIDEVRITKGVARYQSAFIPAASEAPDSGPGAAPVFRTLGLVFSPILEENKGVLSNFTILGVQPFPYIDLTDGGQYRVTGTVKVKALPFNTPVHRKVRLHEELGGRLIREQWSDPVTGDYSFVGIKGGIQYTVIGYDYAQNYRAVVADNITPEPMP